MKIFNLFLKKNKDSIIDQKEGNLDTSNENNFECLKEMRINNKKDEVFDAWISDDLERMIQVTNIKTNLTNRHFLLQSIVEKTYKLREQQYYKTLCLKYAEIHFSEFDKIAPVLRNSMNGILPRVVTFQNFSTVLTEIGEYEKAISICEKAIKYGLKDGTKSNYEGRIERIKKKIVF